MLELERVRDDVLQLFANDSWIQFVHEGLLPAYTSQEKVNNAVAGKLTKHCAICRNINGCCFPKNNMPTYPPHPNCHCILVDIEKPQVTAECRRDKFEGYVFSPTYEKKGKAYLYRKWGYDIMDITYLMDELVRQAEEKYSNGDFTLGKLDDYGQRISIVTQLKNIKEESIVKFITGWMVYPDGNIQNTTPFSGEVE